MLNVIAANPDGAPVDWGRKLRHLPPGTISYAVPCQGRYDELAQTLPSVIAAANLAPPVELVLVDYSSPQPLEGLDLSALQPPNAVTIVKFNAHPWFNCTHARNLGIRGASGDYVMASSCDVGAQPGLFAHLHQVLSRGADFLTPSGNRPGFVVARRTELLEAGGFDERFEFYGPDDKELKDRLIRRGGRRGRFDYDLLVVGKTPDALKFAGYREDWSGRKRELVKWTHELYDRILAEGGLVANAGQEWGAL